MNRQTLYANLMVFAASQAAFALPSAEHYGDLVAISKNTAAANAEKGAPLAFKDTDDDSQFYVPYDQLYIAKDNQNRPMFGLVYDEAIGGKLSFAIRAGYSQDVADTIALMRTKKTEDGRPIKVSPLAPVSGRWMLAMNKEGMGEIYLGAVENKDTVLPNVPVAFDMLIKPKYLGLIVDAFRTGGGLGLNYQYTFRTVLTPFQFKASIHWKHFHSFMQDELKTMTVKEAQAKGCWGIFGTCLVSGQAKATSTNYSQVRNVVRKAKTSQIIKIWWRGGDLDANAEQRTERMIDEITKLVMTQMFKPINASWQVIDTPAPSAGCSTEVSGQWGGGAACYANATSYVYNSDQNFEEVYYEYNFKIEKIAVMPAIVGGTLGYLCKDNPDLFYHRRLKAPGCPTEWTDKGLLPAGSGGPQPATPVADEQMGAPISLGRPPID